MPGGHDPQFNGAFIMLVLALVAYWAGYGFRSWQARRDDRGHYRQGFLDGRRDERAANTGRQLDHARRDHNGRHAGVRYRTGRARVDLTSSEPARRRPAHHAFDPTQLLIEVGR